MAGWAQFRDRFITPAGRVVDVSNKHVSHSEGQGYAMLFAVAANDRDTFDRVWGWTRATLQSRPDDALLSWRWMPDDPDAAGDMGRVDDPNNATDGDLLVAWALTRASQRWSEPSYRSDAVTLAGDILRLTVLERDGVLMMLPGVDGFRRDGAVILNPSYYVFPAIDALGMLTGDAIWQRLSANGADLIQEARFGRWNLPPDWLLVRYQEADPPAETETETAEDAGTDDAAGPAEANAEGAEPDATAGPEPDADPGATADAPAEDTADGPPETDTEANTEADAETGAEAGEPLPRLDLPEGFEPAFGFNAIRIPLNLIWGGRQTPERLEPFITFWGHFDGARFTPSWTDLTKDTVTVYESNPGFQAVFVLTSAAWDDWTLGTVTLPDLGDDADYYASALWLQVGLAREGWV
nr:glycosyl hydrolase family 8 [Roseospira visakhapatnamensis]